jgi:T3SS EscN ATPase C-terminal domain
VHRAATRGVARGPLWPVLRSDSTVDATVERTVDDAVRAVPAIQQWLKQRREEIADWDTSLAALLTLAGPG